MKSKEIFFFIILIVLLAPMQVKGERISLTLLLEISLDESGNFLFGVSLNSLLLDAQPARPSARDENNLIVQAVNEDGTISESKEVGFNFYLPGSLMSSNIAAVSLDIAYNPSIRYIKVYYDGAEKLTIDLRKMLCNSNGNCESREAGYSISENFYSCPSDCKFYSEDSICLSPIGDHYCDLDCYGDEDCNAENCNDGVQNQDETETDSGGVCSSNCMDGEKNGNEEGIDCGGNCANACLTLIQATDEYIIGNMQLSRLIKWIELAFAKPPIELNAGLVSYYSLDANPQTHLGTVADASGNGNSGTLYTNDGAANKAVLGVKGSALSFDGVNDYISIASFANFPTSQGTIAVWVKPGALNNYNNILDFSSSLSSNADRFTFERHNGHNSGGCNGKPMDAIAFGVCNSGASCTTTCTNTALAAGAWYHLAGTWNSSGVYIYVNGVFENFQPGATMPSSTSYGYIGNIVQGIAGRYFKGTIDEIKIWSRSLSEEEIRQNYNNEKQS